MSNLEKKLYELPELIRKNGGPIPMSLGGIYLAAKNGQIPTVKIGKRIFVPEWYVAQLLSRPDTTAASGQ